MPPRLPCHPGWTASFCTALAAWTAAPARGDEASLAGAWRSRGAVEARLGVKPVTRLDPQAGEVPEGEAKVALEAQAAYEDNIFLSAEDPKSDTVIRLSPSLAYRKGDATEGEGAELRFAYRPTGVFYLDHHDNNRIDHRVNLEAGWRGRAVAVAYAGELVRAGDATADTGVQTDRTEWRHVVRLAWTPRERLSWELAAGQSSSQYDEARFYDSKEWFGEAALRFAYSPKTRISLAYRAGRFEVEDAGRQTVQRTTARLEWKPRQKIGVDLELGAEHRTFDAGSQTSPVVEARIAWLPRQGTELYLTGYRREQASAYFPGQNYRLTGGAVGISQKLGERWTGKLEGGLEKATYERVSGDAPSGRDDRILFVMPSLEYRFTEHFRGGVFFRYAQNRSNRDAFGYQARSTGLQLRYEF